MATPRSTHYSRPTSGTIAGGRHLFGADARGQGAAAGDLEHAVPLGGAGQGGGLGSGSVAHGVPMAAAAAAQAAAVIALAKGAPLGGAAGAAGAATGNLSGGSSGGGGTPEAPTSGLTTFTVTSANAGQQPFTVGHAFKQGDIPSGQTLTGLQCSIKNTWPDGSAKFAVLSGYATLTSNVARTVGCQIGTAPAGSNVATSALSAVTASIAFGASTASFSSSDWSSPHQTITAGPLMSSWTYRKQIGSDAHLVAWLEVRAYSNGAVEVLPWIENGYLSVASPTAKSGRAVFTLNGATKYDSINDANYTGPYDGFAVVNAGTVQIAAQCRMCLVSGTQNSHWAGTDPGVTPSHDVAYLVATKLVPAYRPTSINEADIVTWCVTNGAYSPMRTRLTEGMGGTGYSHDIGLLPMNSAIYLVTGDRRAYRAVLNWGYSLGSYAIHYRDQTTNRPLLFASYPNKSTNTGGDLTPSASGGEPYRYATSHHPAAAYLPYLISGWNWFIEAIQFQVTLHYLASPPSSRETSNYFLQASAGGYGQNNQGGPRAVGWQWRTLAMCACITPDADTTMRAQFVTALNYNATAYRGIHESGTWSGAANFTWAPNSLGLVWEPGFGGTTIGQRVPLATWQDDFVTMSVGLSSDLQVTGTAQATDDLIWFRNFKYQCVIGRLGAQNVPGRWNYRVATPYNIWAGTKTGSATLAYPSTWGQAFSDNFPYEDPVGQQLAETNSGLTGDDLQGGNIGGGGMSTSYWGNMQPAIAYAVSHGAPGAAAAYDRMIAASNFATKAAEFNAIPIWGIKPHNHQALPSWLSALALWQWYEIPNTLIGSVDPNPMPPGQNYPGKVTAWCGFAVAEYLDSSGALVAEMCYGASGGHGDYAGNEVDTLKLNATTPAWVERHARTPDAYIINHAQTYLAEPRAPTYHPASTHTYYLTTAINRFRHFSIFPYDGLEMGGQPEAPGGFPYPNGGGRTATFDLIANQWKSIEYTAQWTGAGGYPGSITCKDPHTEDVYYARNAGDGWWRWRPSSTGGSWSRLSTSTRGLWEAGSAVDPWRKRILIVGATGGGFPPEVRNLDGTQQSVTFGGLGAGEITVSGNPGVVYDYENDAYLAAWNSGGFWPNGTLNVRRIDAGTLVVDAPTITNPAPARHDPSNVVGGFRYVHSLRAVVYHAAKGSNVRIMRTA